MSDWRDMDSAPKGVKLIAGYHNDLGKWRTITARYYRPGTLEWDDPDEHEDEHAPEGWYEEGETWDHVEPCRTPEKWQPLPEPPCGGRG